MKEKEKEVNTHENATEERDAPFQVVKSKTRGPNKEDNVE